VSASLVADSSVERIPRVTIEGVPVARLGFDETVTTLGRWLESDTPRRVATANLDFLALAARDGELAETLQTADLVTPDGEPVVWLSRLRGRACPERVAGSDLVIPLVGEAARRGRSIYLLGGAPGAAEEAAKVLCDRFHGLRIAGIASPRLATGQHAAWCAAADAVARSGADLLLVALGCPKQDLFLRHVIERSGCRVGIGVGASLDFLAGSYRRAPRWVQRVKLEWLFRLVQEPRRLAARYALDFLYLSGVLTRLLAERAFSKFRPFRPTTGIRRFNSWER